MSKYPVFQIVYTLDSDLFHKEYSAYVAAQTKNKIKHRLPESSKLKRVNKVPNLYSSQLGFINI